MRIVLLRQPKFESLTSCAYFPVIKAMKELPGDSGHLAIKRRTINMWALSLWLLYDTYSNSVPESAAVKTNSRAEAKLTHTRTWGVQKNTDLHLAESCGVSANQNIRDWRLSSALSRPPSKEQCQGELQHMLFLLSGKSPTLPSASTQCGLQISTEVLLLCTCVA